ncbi:glycosyltransferase family 39 protein [Atractiella rhizophila]|nr:glycosyltransferase family 39 protein [Atractiella rhizophila]
MNDPRLTHRKGGGAQLGVPPTNSLKKKRSREDNKEYVTLSQLDEGDTQEERQKDEWDGKQASFEPFPQPNSDLDLGMMVCIFIVSAILRFWKIHYPPSVVFDEVHFGKFASYYLRREYFFDVHPPLAKLLLAFAGWVIGYDGHFEFENIGDDYLKNDVPYIGLRALPAIFGSLIPVVMYATMRESGYPRPIALFSAILVVFDNAHISQSRLILLDSALILFTALALYCYIKFYKLRYHEFTKPWWTWLCLTGVALSCSISCKGVGLFTFYTIGAAVVWDLWKLLDIRRGLTMEHVGRHFFARAFGLILIPAIVYMSFFWIHFAILIKSGPGDDFMSPAFQETLIGSPMTFHAQEIKYHDAITIMHKQTKAYLHSHLERYPLKYDDGRISTKGLLPLLCQQVTAYNFNDTNNEWIVLPTKELPETGRGRIVRHHDIVQLLHRNTNSILITHDVASPLMPTNTEFTTWPEGDIAAKYDDSLFKLEIIGGHEGQQWKTRSGHFKLIHEQTKVAMWTHSDTLLPEWAFKQQEVNGNKNVKDKTNTWFVDEILMDPNETDYSRPEPKVQKNVKRMNFFKKFFELQFAMLQHNAGLTDSHPYASTPINWPFLLSGISFWTGKEGDREQIYMIGNVVSWWIGVIALSVLVGIMGADQLSRRRGELPIPDPIRNRLYNSTGFFLLAWLAHYLPFFLMNRQRFLHHYLPAHIFSCLAAGGVFHFVVSQTINYPVSVAPPVAAAAPTNSVSPTPAGITQVTPARKRRATRAEISIPMLAILFITAALLFSCYIFFAPLTYGSPGLTAAQVNRRRLMSTWTLHYAK